MLSAGRPEAHSMTSYAVFVSAIALLVTSLASSSVAVPAPEVAVAPAVDNDVAGNHFRLRRDVDKRARMSAWGRRSAADEGDELEGPGPGDLGELGAEDEKRAGRMSAWGRKRLAGPAKIPRSKWSTGTMAVWGKRAASGIDLLDDDYYYDQVTSENAVCR